MLLFLSLILIAQESPKSDLFLHQLAITPSHQVVLLPEGLSVVEEKSLPSHSRPPRQPGTQELPNPERLNPRAPLEDLGAQHQRQGQRLLALLLAPGEHLAVKQTGPSPQRIRLSLVPPSEGGPMADEIRRVNRRPLDSPPATLEVRNVTQAPVRVVLVVRGPVAVPYRLEFHRQRS